MYALNLLEMSLRAGHARPRLRGHGDEVLRALRVHRRRPPTSRACGTRRTRFFYDVLRLADGQQAAAEGPLGGRPAAAGRHHDPQSLGTLHRLPEVAARLRWFLTNKPEYADVVGARRTAATGSSSGCCPWSGPDQLIRILARMLDAEEFLSPYGLRTLSRRAPGRAVHGRRSAAQDFTVGYEPAESTSGLFGGNSNWRGPVWMPVNYLLIEALREFAAFFGDDLLVEYPTGPAAKRTLAEIADDLSAAADHPVPAATRTGRRPIYGACELFQNHPDWQDLLAFPEYFHGDNGAGLGAWHQTGWTALVVDLILATRP